MLELTQEVVDPKFGTCYGTCLASILEFPLSAVPQVPRDLVAVEAYHNEQHKGCDPQECRSSEDDKRNAYWHDMWRHFKDEHNIVTVRFDMAKFSRYDSHRYRDVLHILTGLSPRDRDLKDNQGSGRLHSVVGKGGRVYWDPHPDRTGLLTIDEIEFIMPADPSKPMCASLRRQ